jgi:hypothetical protein
MASESWKRVLCHFGVGCAIMLSVGMARISQAQAQSGSPVGVLVEDPSTGNDCIAGTCSAHQPIPFGGSLSVPYTTQRTFSNGDAYQIDGMISISESANGLELPATMYFTITFLSGPGINGTSVGNADTFVLYDFLDWTQNGNSNGLTAAAVGKFSSGVNSQSTVTVQASYCGGATTSALLGPFSPPGSFSNSTMTTVPPCSAGGLLLNTIYTINVRAGTQPGSYIQVGNVSAPPLTGVATHDANGDLFSDITWRNSNGSLAIWLMNGGSVLLSSGMGVATGTWAIVGQRDFNGDGKADWLWRDGSGDTAIWFLDGQNVLSTASLGNIPSTWTVIATGDFNGDGYGDILWRDGSGNVSVWLMEGSQVLSAAGLGVVPLTYTVVGTGDFDGNGKTDLLWRDGSGDTSIWFMNGTQVSSAASLGTVPVSWSVSVVGDFNGNGMSDIVWRDTSGDVAIWLMNGAQVSQSGGLGNVPSTWTIVSTGDYNGDGNSDLLWQDTSGDTSVWFMNGIAVLSTAPIGTIPTTWTVQVVNAN